uniref:Uncharacterized protein n=1 Tax=Chromera velia CCMP2878 TaxID=1169474 RepID=A0A0G4HEU1_9ALVE|eukprot:Cvel_26741.t1-p1 / transcript=Cvel_26741.t1 / gene=Cvel_26741 / organism=Chromera_velia_CCMP2878 / gene_product=hypothetical protein / transcript_product=hypothetical protein / location=Cvel_scaffold3228:13567-15549(-) / protein_length=196 / sequence_SO=supercontig / SO=protein_coding / is_pseudo=false
MLFNQSFPTIFSSSDRDRLHKCSIIQLLAGDIRLKCVRGDITLTNCAVEQTVENPASLCCAVLCCAVLRERQSYPTKAREKRKKEGVQMTSHPPSSAADALRRALGQASSSCSSGQTEQANANTLEDDCKNLLGLLNKHGLPDHLKGGDEAFTKAFTAHQEEVARQELARKDMSRHDKEAQGTSAAVDPRTDPHPN